jgi:3-isopropylmalate/(R)-2-methylmalate dehydratase large subunit
MGEPLTLLDKVWNEHVVADLGDGFALIHVDRQLIHDLSGTRALLALAEAGHPVRNPELTFATPDHTVSTQPNFDHAGPRYEKCVDPLRQHSRRHGIRLFDIGEPGHGIVHVIGPELGLTLPGATILCGDSHTCTHGGLGALAWGIGVSEIVHVLATQTVIQRKPKRMRIAFDGALSNGVEPKDLILYAIGRLGSAAADGYAIEYAGSAIAAMSIEGRMTVCNLSIELGAKIGMVAPDDAAFQYINGRELAPAGENWERAVAHWRTLPGDDGAVFDSEVVIEAAGISPQVTWGTSPEHVVGIDQPVPDPAAEPDTDKRQAMAAALAYSGLEPGTPMEGISIDHVFIGSCTNSRLSDLRRAAQLARGRRVADRVCAWVVPGSQDVKHAAESEGLDRIFTEAGFEWREPGCSLCVGSNGETVAAGQRCVSTTNRNFVGRQGKGSRTHLVSPGMAVAAAVSGCIADVRKIGT